MYTNLHVKKQHVFEKYKSGIYFVKKEEQKTVVKWAGRENVSYCGSLDGKLLWKRK